MVTYCEEARTRRTSDAGDRDVGKGGKVECSINNKVVASYDKADLVAPGKLKSTDGVYGLRFAHNTEAIVTGLQVIKQ